MSHTRRILAGIAIALAAAFYMSSGEASHAGLRCNYVVEKTQADRAVQQANLNTAASAGYRLAQQTAAQTVLVKCS